MPSTYFPGDALSKDLSFGIHAQLIPFKILLEDWLCLSGRVLLSCVRPCVQSPTCYSSPPSTIHMQLPQLDHKWL